MKNQTPKTELWVGQFHDEDNRVGIWTVLSDRYEFEFDRKGNLITVLPINGNHEEATEAEIAEAVKFYEENEKQY